MDQKDSCSSKLDEHTNIYLYISLLKQFRCGRTSLNISSFTVIACQKMWYSLKYFHVLVTLFLKLLIEVFSD